MVVPPDSIQSSNTNTPPQSQQSAHSGRFFTSDVPCYQSNANGTEISTRHHGKGDGDVNATESALLLPLLQAVRSRIFSLLFYRNFSYSGLGKTNARAPVIARIGNILTQMKMLLREPDKISKNDPNFIVFQFYDLI